MLILNITELSEITTFEYVCYSLITNSNNYKTYLWSNSYKNKMEKIVNNIEGITQNGNIILTMGCNSH